MSNIEAATMNKEPQVTYERLDEIGEAFNRNDIDAVMRCFTEDAVFDHAVGPDVHGTRFEGKEALRNVFQSLFDAVENVHWEKLDLSIKGNKAYCQYRRIAKLKSGETQDFLSIDVLTFNDGLILHKDTYYKQRGA